jgi:hypothetical protein
MHISMHLAHNSVDVLKSLFVRKLDYKFWLTMEKGREKSLIEMGNVGMKLEGKI